jgi:hypothetical protein
MSGSNAIAIPSRKGKGPARNTSSGTSSSSFQSTPLSSSSRSGGFAAPNSNHNRFGSFATPNRFNSNYNYGSFGSPSSASTTPSSSPSDMRLRRESLMSPTFSAQEHTVVNVGEEEAPKLITCVKASQGFDWNVGMSACSPFLPLPP